MGGPTLLKILVVATLLMGFAALLANLIPPGGDMRSLRRLFRTIRNPGSTVTAMLGEAQATEVPPTEHGTDTTDPKVRKTEAEWKTLLTAKQYRVAREGETERPFSGRFWDHHEVGTYHCVACAQLLFSHVNKYETGTGWPSFTRPVDPDDLDRITDISYGTIRTEIVCARCESHLGHLFDDGPQPTGLRYCINSAALTFVATEGAVPGREQAG